MPSFSWSTVQVAPSFCRPTTQAPPGRALSGATPAIHPPASGAAGAGASGEAGASGSAGANGGGSAWSAGDPGPDPSCADQCGKVHGVGINGSCRYTLPCRLPGSFTGMVVFINGEMVAEDPSRTNGWEFNFTDPSQTTFQFFGQACADVTSSGASLDIDYLCELAAP